MAGSYIYHVAEEARWKGAGDEGYLPPGFEKDGFIHGTKEPHFVMPVANRFLSGSGTQLLRDQMKCCARSFIVPLHCSV